MDLKFATILEKKHLYKLLNLIKDELNVGPKFLFVQKNQKMREPMGLILLPYVSKQLTFNTPPEFHPGGAEKFGRHQMQNRIKLVLLYLKENLQKRGKNTGTRRENDSFLFGAKQRFFFGCKYALLIYGHSTDSLRKGGSKLRPKIRTNFCPIYLQCYECGISRGREGGAIRW